MMTGLGLLRDGGPILYFLIVLNIFGVGLILLKWHDFRSANKRQNDIMRQVQDKVDLRLKGNKKISFLDYLELMREEVAFFIHRLDRRLTTIKVIALVAPLIGLLGTVWGILISFNVMSEQGAGNPALFAHGISKALVTTVGGLIVAIIHHLAFHYFNSKLLNFEMLLEEKMINGVDSQGVGEEE